MSVVVGCRVDAQPVASAAGPPPFDPLSLSPSALYDALVASSLWADAGRTVPAVVTDPVQVWDDLSGNANHVGQSTLASRPVRSATGLTYDGGDTILKSAGLVGLPGAQPYTVVCVAAMTTNSTDLWGTSASGLFGRTGAATSCRLSFGAGPIASAAAPALDTVRDILCEANGATCRVEIGGSLLVSGSAGTQVPTRIQIGSNAAGAGNIVGEIRFWMLVNRLLTAPEKVDLHTYCVSRFGVP